MFGLHIYINTSLEAAYDYIFTVFAFCMSINCCNSLRCANCNLSENSILEICQPWRKNPVQYPECFVAGGVVFVIKNRNFKGTASHTLLLFNLITSLGCIYETQHQTNYHGIYFCGCKCCMYCILLNSLFFLICVFTFTVANTVLSIHKSRDSTERMISPFLLIFALLVQFWLHKNALFRENFFEKIPWKCSFNLCRSFHADFE